jgi:hypothetical protein
VEVTTLEVRERSEYLTAASPPADPYDPLTDALNDEVSLANVLVGDLTCRAIGPPGTPGAPVPTEKEDLARVAVTMKAEQIYAARGTAAAREGGVSAGMLRSISAGPWSESYFGPEDARKANVLDLDPLLAQTLWALAPEECRERWLELWSGVYAPASASTEVAWGLRDVFRGY